MREDIAQLLRSECHLLKRDALPIAEKVMKILDWYGYATLKSDE
jgi:hypothetical protein